MVLFRSISLRGRSKRFSGTATLACNEGSYGSAGATNPARSSSPALLRSRVISGDVVSSGRVRPTGEPAARTAWHTHPLGQTLIVTSGLGWAQRWGGPIEEIRPGDVIWFPPGEKHWHGATPTTAMTHIAIREALNGKPADWMEKVSDEQYQAK